MGQSSWLCMTKRDVTQMECEDTWWEHLSWDEHQWYEPKQQYELLELFKGDHKGK